MKQPMKSRDVLPKNVQGVGWGGVKVDNTTRILPLQCFIE